MRLHRFFIDQSVENSKDKEIAIKDSDLIHQWRNVFRYTAGSFLILLDNSGREVMGQISSISIREVRVFITEERENKNMPKKEVYVFQSLIKKSTFEWEIEKLTELGVTHIVPVLSERSEKKNVNVERCKKILKEASEQCGRGTIPYLSPVCNLEKTLAIEAVSLVAFHTDGPLFKKEEYEKENSLGIYIGPEGGWGERDLSFFKVNTIPVVSLGSLTLRSETASVAISSLLLL